MMEATTEGTGELPAAGMKCELEYTGKLEGGKVFDTTKDSLTGSFNLSSARERSYLGGIWRWRQ